MNFLLSFGQSPLWSDPQMDPQALVYFVCVKDHSRLRVRITSPGYNQEANCQFPRAIRAEGKTYTAPVSAIKFARSPQGTFFYRVAAKAVKVVDPEEERENEVANIGANRDEVLRELGLVPVRPKAKSKAKSKAKASVVKIYEDDSQECIVCFTDPHEVVLVPCGHFCLCGGCAHQINEMNGKCPLCRGDIAQIVTRDEIQT